PSWPIRGDDVHPAASGSSRLFAERDPVAERVRYHQLSPPRLILKPRSHVGIVPGGQFRVERFDARRMNEGPRTGACVTRMLAQVQPEGTAGDLSIKGKAVTEAVLPIDAE